MPVGYSDELLMLILKSLFSSNLVDFGLSIIGSLFFFIDGFGSIKMYVELNFG